MRILVLCFLVSSIHSYRLSTHDDPKDTESVSTINSGPVIREDDPTNYYGDPIDGDPIADADVTCVYSEDNNEGPQNGNPAPKQRRSPRPALSPRVSGKQPLRDAKDGTQDSFNELMGNILKNAQNDQGDLALGIMPSETQKEKWKINYNHVDIPIGATGEWRPFGNEPQEYATWGLHGCTAAVIAGPGGVWLGHWWEASKAINGPSSHVKTYVGRGATNLGVQKRGTRTTMEFQAVAVDILGQVTPEEERQNRDTWISMADLKQYYNDPFSDPTQVDVWYMTKAKSPKNNDRKYGGHIDQFKAKFAEILPGSHYSESTYVGLEADDYRAANQPFPMPEDIIGTIAVQYTPYDHDGGDDNCTPIARVRIFYENNKDAVIDRSWPATKEQLGSKRRRDACAMPFPNSTMTTQTVTKPPSVTSNAITEAHTVTSNCQACTLIGGNTNSTTCTSVAKCTFTSAISTSTNTTSPTPTKTTSPISTKISSPTSTKIAQPTPSPTFAVFVSNSTVNIGDAEHKDKGKQLGKDMYKGLHDFCKDPKSCKTGKENRAPISNDLTIIDGGDEPLKPYLYLSTAKVADLKTFERMLTAGLATWISATANACQDVEYEELADATGSGCGEGPVKREDGVTFMPHTRTLRRCSDTCGGGSGGGLKCHYMGRICKAPETTTVIMSDGKDPYANLLEIQVDFDTGGNDFAKVLCEMLVQGLTDAAIALAPEFAPEDIAEELDFETMCGEL
ncbi:putative SGNH hydrolase-type esterase domain-containing protein [Seiridium unicorne]|uniref:SGNH hydrolase-type esterase domain-containing protein n=1 Tax=Seiridium unicorne TaxID=138068 RepID=A0ABR2UZD8_9PEZI